MFLSLVSELSLLLWGLTEHVEDTYYHYLLNISYCWGFLYLIILDSFPQLICHNIKRKFLWILLTWSFLESQQNSEHCCLMITYDNSQYLCRVWSLLLPFAGQSLPFGLNPLPCHSLTWKEMLGKAQNELELSNFHQTKKQQPKNPFILLSLWFVESSFVLLYNRNNVHGTGVYTQ